MKPGTVFLGVAVAVGVYLLAGCGSDGAVPHSKDGPSPGDAREAAADLRPRLDRGAEDAGSVWDVNATDTREIGGGDSSRRDRGAEDGGLAGREAAGGRDTAWEDAVADEADLGRDAQDRRDTHPDAAEVDERSAWFDAHAGEAGLTDAADASQPQGASDGPADAAEAREVGPTFDSAGSPDGGVLLDAGGEERIWVYLLAGQSNMMGFGICQNLTEEDAAAVPGASIYYSDPVSWNRQAGQWLPLAPGFGATTDYFGPELSFARRLRELHPSRRLAIIKVDEGSTALFDRWKAPTGDLYQLLLHEARTQLAVLAAHGRPQLAGLLWMQGESDGVAEDRAEAYQQNLADFVGALRSELGSSLLPVVAGLIATDYAGRFPEQVREATRAVAMQLGRMEVVETDDLRMTPDENVHYDTDGYLRLGWRFATAMDTMQATRWRFPEDFAAVQGEGCFSYRDRTDTGAAPLVYDSASSRWAGDGGDVAIGEGFMVPGIGHQAELAFWAPFAGDVEITFRTTVPSAESTGVWIEAASPAKVLAGPAGHVVWRSFSVAVAQGDEITFRTSPGPAPDPDVDTTNWEIDIVMTRVDE